MRLARELDSKVANGLNACAFDAPTGSVVESGPSPVGDIPSKRGMPRLVEGNPRHRCAYLWVRGRVRLVRGEKCPVRLAYATLCGVLESDGLDGSHWMARDARHTGLGSEASRECHCLSRMTDLLSGGAARRANEAMWCAVSLKLCGEDFECIHGYCFQQRRRSEVGSQRIGCGPRSLRAKTRRTPTARWGGINALKHRRTGVIRRDRARLHNTPTSRVWVVQWTP
jgi:hypothetical protein